MRHDRLIATALTRTSPELRKLRPLSEHCDALRYVYLSYEEDRPALVEDHGECCTWSHAAEWLHLASGLIKVEVDAGRFDDTDLMFRPAFDYNEQHGLHQSLLAQELVAFNMIWGSLESVAKLVELPTIPRTKGASFSNIDRVLYAMNCAAGRVGIIPLYREITGTFISNLTMSSLRGCDTANALLSKRRHIGYEGFGLHLVRKIRNSFAHGAASLSFDQDTAVPPLILVVHLSSRITLLAQAMLLAMADDARRLRVYHPMRPHVPWHAETLMAAAYMLHLIEPNHDHKQMWLLKSLDPAAREDVERDFCGEWMPDPRVL